MCVVSVLGGGEGWGCVYICVRARQQALDQWPTSAAGRYHWREESFDEDDVAAGGDDLAIGATTPASSPSWPPQDTHESYP